MKTSLAMWHYPHRTTEENVKFFSNCDFDILSLHGAQVTDSNKAEDKGAGLAKALRENSRLITVHSAMPRSHKKEDVEFFCSNIENISEWQKNYGLIEILSFDVPGAVRDNVSGYIDYVLANVSGCKVALEDFGLNENELSQLEYLKGNERFGYLIDIGHMFIRLTGKRSEGATLFQNSPFEGAKKGEAGHEEFLTALRSKTFPIHEIHLHNNDGIDDLHYFLEDGKLDIKMIARVLKEFGFDGVLTIESAPGFKFECRGDEADERIIKTLKYWEKMQID